MVVLKRVHQMQVFERWVGWRAFAGTLLQLAMYPAIVAVLSLHLLATGVDDRIASNESTAAASVEPAWRLTKHGWQDANSWARLQRSEEVHSPFHNIHPTLLAADILLAALGSLIWATKDERQLDRLFGRD